MLFYFNKFNKGSYHKLLKYYPYIYLENNLSIINN